MADVRVLILRAAGTNCENETAAAWEMVGAKTRIIHFNALRESPAALTESQILTIPGGFCHGDDVSAGKILATEMKLFLGDALRSFVASGKLVLGICNGFQVLAKTGLLPGRTIGDRSVTLTANTSGRYEDRWVHLAPVKGRCRFVDEQRLMLMPVAHGEGRVVTADDKTTAALREGGFVAFRYIDENGLTGDYPVNPNGSVDSIAGLTDDTGQVLGLMPHPERNTHPTHHPAWTRLTSDREPDGLRLFRAGVAAMR